MIIRFVLIFIMIISMPGIIIVSKQISESGPFGRYLVLIYALVMFIACNFILYQKLFREPRGQEKKGEEGSTLKEKLKIMLPVLLVVGAVIGLSLIIGNYLAEKIEVERLYEILVTVVEFIPAVTALLVVIILGGIVIWKSGPY